MAQFFLALAPMLLAQVLLVAALLAWLLPRRFHAAAAVASLLALIPLPEVSPAMALRGLWGDPSITSLQLLALLLFGRGPTLLAPLTAGWRAPALLALLAALFYLLALGLGDFDPYRLGYQPVLSHVEGPVLSIVEGPVLSHVEGPVLSAVEGPVLLILVLALPALYYWWRGQALWLWLLSIDLLAWAAGLSESPNLWDTLLDPLLAIACLFLAVRNGWRSYRQKP